MNDSATTNALKNVNDLKSKVYEKSSFFRKMLKLLYLSLLCDLIAEGNH